MTKKSKYVIGIVVVLIALALLLNYKTIFFGGDIWHASGLNLKDDEYSQPFHEVSTIYGLEYRGIAEITGYLDIVKRPCSIKEKADGWCGADTEYAWFRITQNNNKLLQKYLNDLSSGGNAYLEPGAIGIGCIDRTDNFNDNYEPWISLFKSSKTRPLTVEIGNSGSNLELYNCSNLFWVRKVIHWQ